MGNVIEFREQQAIEAEAWQWLIRLDGDAPLSQLEIQALREWSARSPAHRAELKKISTFWNSANTLTQLEVPLRPSSENPKPARAWSASSLGTRVAAAAAILCVSAAAWMWWSKSPVDRNGSYATTIGQQRTLALADGSKVQINTDSQLRVDYTENLRKITLLRGEAFFTVAPNAQKPFEVYAAQGVVRAVGTAFAVHVQDAAIDVTVTKGQVNVMPRTAGTASGSANNPESTRQLVSLRAGQTATFPGLRVSQNPPEAKQLSPPELNRRLAWHEGYWVFTGQPLDVVVDELNRYSPVTLEIADPSLAKLAVGGRFKVGDLDAFYDVLQSNFGIHSVRVDDRHIELRPGRAR